MLSNSEVLPYRKMSRRGVWIESIKGKEFKRKRLVNEGGLEQDVKHLLELCWVKTRNHNPLYWVHRNNFSPKGVLLARP